MDIFLVGPFVLPVISHAHLALQVATLAVILVQVVIIGPGLAANYVLQTVLTVPLHQFVHTVNLDFIFVMMILVNLFAMLRWSLVEMETINYAKLLANQPTLTCTGMIIVKKLVISLYNHLLSMMQNFVASLVLYKPISFIRMAPVPAHASSSLESSMPVTSAILVFQD
ncbi:MAG: hypothetical protein EOP48_26015 [Sphingobacteriales bacterium]|nr:MAG: hypothetical protein EOP48_26015 [Sphingobacteriales bacterium]